MTYGELVNVVAASLGQTKQSVRRTLDQAAATIVGTARSGEPVRVPGLGKFVIKERAARTGRNPHSGAQVHIPARVVLTFKPSSTIKLGAPIQLTTPS